MLLTKGIGMVAVSSVRGWRPFPLTVRDPQLARSGLPTLPVPASRDQLVQLLPWQAREASMARAHSQEWGELGMGTSSVWEMCGRTHRAFQRSRDVQESVNTHKPSYVSTERRCLSCCILSDKALAVCRETSCSESQLHGDGTFVRVLGYFFGTQRGSAFSCFAILELS